MSLNKCTIRSVLFSVGIEAPVVSTIAQPAVSAGSAAGTEMVFFSMAKRVVGSSRILGEPSRNVLGSWCAGVM